MTNPYSNGSRDAHEPTSPYASGAPADWVDNSARLPAWQEPHSVEQPAGRMRPRSWVITVLLCLFLGGFGAHSFYTGYTKRGLTQLGLYVAGWLTTAVLLGFVFWFVLALWVILDLCMVCTRSGTFREDADGVPLLR